MHIYCTSRVTTQKALSLLIHFLIFILLAPSTIIHLKKSTAMSIAEAEEKKA